MPGEVRRVALPIREDLRIRILAPDERVVGRNTAVVADAQDLADVVVELLREQRLAPAVLPVVLEMIVHRQIDHAVGPERCAARHRPARNPGVELEYLLHLEKCCAVEPRACERARHHPIGGFLDVVQVHKAVRCELRVHDDRPQWAGVDARGGPACERLGREQPVTHDAHVSRVLLVGRIAARGISCAARALGDQEIALRRERDVARAREPFGDRNEAHAEQLAGRALALWLAIRRARSRHPRVEHERIGRRGRRRWARGRIGARRRRRARGRIGRCRRAPLRESEQQRQRA